MSIKKLREAADKHVNRTIIPVANFLKDNTHKETMPEKLFVDRYLTPLKQGNHLAFNELLRIAGGPNRTILIKDDQGKTLYELPPLIKSPDIVNLGIVTEVDMSLMGKGVINKNKSRPASGDRMLNNFITNTTQYYEENIKKNSVDLKASWKKVFDRYETIDEETVKEIEPTTLLDDINDDYE